MGIRIILLILLGIQFNLSADFLPSNTALQSAVLLTDSRGSACASGFLLTDGKLVTASHVIQSLCNNTDCPELVVKRATALNAPATEGIPYKRTGALKVIANIPWLDLAILDGGFEAGAFRLSRPSSDQEIHLLSFPRCQNLTLSTGSMTKDAALWIDTSVEAAPGSSGGVAFDKDYNVVGVAQQATSASDAIMARLYGTSYRLRFLKASYAASRIEGLPQQSFDSESEALFNYYKEQILPLRGWDRLIQGADFISTVQSIKSPSTFPELSTQQSLSLLSLGDYAGSTLRPSGDANLLMLVMAANLESHGPFKKFLVPARSDQMTQELAKIGLSQEQSQKLLGLFDAFKAGDYYGFDLSALKKAALWLLIFCVLSFSIGTSAGYIFALTKGSLIKRTLVTVFWGILCWPVSILLFAIVKRRSLK